jgi:hypothetical protein
MQLRLGLRQAILDALIYVSLKNKMGVRDCRKIAKFIDAWKLILKEERVLHGPQSQRREIYIPDNMQYTDKEPISVAERINVRFCGYSLAGIAGSRREGRIGLSIKFGTGNPMVAGSNPVRLIDY